MKTKVLIVLIIVSVIIVAFGFYFLAKESQSEILKSPGTSEKVETPGLEKIKDSDLIMDVIRRESGVSQELLANSCVSSIMQETEDLILVYVNWNCGDVGGGTRAILKKQDAQYKFIAMFQDPPSCDLMNEFSVPISFYENCY